MGSILETRNRALLRPPYRFALPGRKSWVSPFGIRYDPFGLRFIVGPHCET